MVITLPHQQNTIPLVSTQLINTETVASIVLQEPPSNAYDYPEEHVCSNMNNNSDNSLLTRNTDLSYQPLYSHLNRTTCEWQFTAWVPVNALLTKCRAQRFPRAINLTMYTTYVHIELKQVQVIDLPLKVMTTSIAYIPGTTPFLPVPLHTRSMSTSTDDPALMYPITIEAIGHTSVYFYTIMPLWRRATPASSNVSDLHLTLLHTKMSPGHELYTQAWLLKSVNRGLNFSIQLESFDVYDTNNPSIYEFSLIIKRHLNGYVPYLMTTIKLHTSEEQNITDLEQPLVIGKQYILVLIY